VRACRHAPPSAGGRWALGLCAGVALLACAAGPLHAGVITSSDILAVPKGTVGSGNGTLDYILFTSSQGGAGNSDGSFNGDDANTDLPSGNGKTTADESFITSIGELRSFYILNFPNGSGGSTVNEIVVMVDVNETGGPQTINLGTFDVWRNAGVTPPGDARNNPAANEISSAAQNSTNAAFTGGTKIANLDAAKVLGQVEIGGGFPDRAIFTGINPFDPAYAATDRILFHWTSSDHDNGGESIFLSGSIGPQDIPGAPEPASAALIAGGAVACLLRRPRRRRGA